MLLIPRDFHFEAGSFAYLFFLVPLFIFVFHSARVRRARAMQKLHVLDSLVEGRDLIKSLVIEGLFLLSFVFLVFALMQPVGFGHYPKDVKPETVVAKTVTPVYFLLDTSLSMEVRDGHQSKTRFSLAKEILDTTLDELRGMPAGLETFTSHLHKVSPITYDSFYLRLLLRDVPLNPTEEYGTDFLTVLTELKEQLEHPAQVVLVSDGEDTSTVHAGGKRAEDRRGAIVEMVDFLKAQGVEITTVGVGTEMGGVVPGVLYENKEVISRADAALLKEMASASGTRFYDANKWSVTELASHLVASLSNPEIGDQQIRGEVLSSKVIYKPLFQIPLVLGILLFMLGTLIRPSAQAE